jgi:hypothetical protein
MTFIAPAPTRGLTHHITPSTLGRLAGIDVVLWPDEAPRRAALAEAGQPCLLVLGVEEPVPELGPHEDWAREPLDAEEVRARCLALARRRACGAPPMLDDGLLVHCGAWAAIPPAQVAMVELLVGRIGSVVRKDELVAAAASAGGSSHEEAVKAAMGRLVKRLTPLGLDLRAIRGRGYLLEARNACPVHGTRSAAET